MTTFETKQKQGWMENFDTVVALYYILKSNSALMRVKSPNAKSSDGFVNVGAMEFLDFTYDVELKTKRTLGQPFFELWQRAVCNENMEILPEYMREALGRTWKEYGLTEDGAYSNVYHFVKNKQDRSFMKLKGEKCQATQTTEMLG